MKTLIFISFLSVFTSGIFAQRGGHKGGGGRPAKHGKVVVVQKQHPRRHLREKVVVRSKFRPAKVIVYHPYWGPRHAFNRRWVYFPRHNFYWDNWRQVYFFWEGGAWVVHQKAPAVIVNVNLENEKHYELKENEDDIDDVYSTNDSHKTEYKDE